MNQNQTFSNKEKLVIELLMLEKKYQLMKYHKVNILGITSLKKIIKLQENIETDQSIMMVHD